jgi:pyruvate,water dikinase
MLKELSEFSSKDISVAGVKGAYLGELLTNGFKVPAGFIIPADIKKLDEDEILREFDKIPGEHAAVRSSPVPWDPEGLKYISPLESRMWVRRWELMESIDDCYRSMESRAVRIYRLKNGVTDESQLAIVIQAMLSPESSGAIYTKKGDDKNKLVINACYGGGYAVVSGRVLPDCYVVDREEGKVLEENISPQSEMYGRAGWVQVNPSMREKRKLTEDQIVEIVETAKNIEEHFKRPQSIEFCFDKGELWIVQTKPMV